MTVFFSSIWNFERDDYQFFRKTVSALGRSITAVLYFSSTALLLRFNENTTLNIFGCPPQEQIELKSCACLQNTTLDDDVCPMANSFLLEKECKALANASYILQHRETENELEVYLNLNVTSNISITMVTGNCTFDCSGKNQSLCPLEWYTFSYSQNSGRFPVSNIRPGNYCLMIKLLNYEMCVLYTRLYSLKPMITDASNVVDLGENRFLMFLVIICSVTASFCSIIYLCKRQASAIILIRKNIVV